MSNHDIEKDYVILPKISTIEVNRLGCIHHAQMEFKDKVTVISTGSPLGVSTLVHAFRIIRGQPISNSIDRSYYSPVKEPVDRDFSIKYRLKEPQAIIRQLIEQPTPTEIFNKYTTTSPSIKKTNHRDQDFLNILNIFYSLREDLCLILDKEVVSPLGGHYGEVFFDLILNTPAQVIVFLPNYFNGHVPKLEPFLRYELLAYPADPQMSKISPL